MPDRPAPLPPLLAISPGSGGPIGRLAAWAERLAADGVQWIQVRERTADRELLNFLRRLSTTLPPEVRLLVNARCDLARLSGAAGVHLPANGIPVREARAILGPRSIIGRSTHFLAEVEEAAEAGADYVVFGPVYPPLSKEVHRPTVGLDALTAASALPVPVYALGGVTIDRLAEIAATGATGVAGITLFREPETLHRVVRRAASLFRTDQR